MFDLLTILPLVVAAFVLWKLRQVLGTRGGAERPAPRPQRRDAERPLPRTANDDNVVPMPGSRPVRTGRAAEEEAVDHAAILRHADGNDSVRKGLEAIARRDSMFDPDEFLEGARMAYEMIVTAFADGDRATLQNLLSTEVYDSFAGVLDEREARGERVEASFVGIEDAKIVDAGLDGGEAQVTVSFVSQMVSVTRDAKGQVVEGDEQEVAEVTDVWTFARPVPSDDPNWKLIATDG